MIDGLIICRAPPANRIKACDGVNGGEIPGQRGGVKAGQRRDGMQI